MKNLKLMTALMGLGLFVSTAGQAFAEIGFIDYHHPLSL